jgi:valyl-tRNA synthetase
MAEHRYDPKQIEPRWQRVWEDEQTWHVGNDEAGRELVRARDAARTPAASRTSAI